MDLSGGGVQRHPLRDSCCDFLSMRFRGRGFVIGVLVVFRRLGVSRLILARWLARNPFIIVVFNSSSSLVSPRNISPKSKPREEILALFIFCPSHEDCTDTRSGDTAVTLTKQSRHCCCLVVRPAPKTHTNLPTQSWLLACMVSSQGKHGKKQAIIHTIVHARDSHYFF